MCPPGGLSLPTLLVLLTLELGPVWILVSPEDQASLAYQDNNNYRWGGVSPQSGTQCCQSPGIFTEFPVRARHCSSVRKTTPQEQSCRLSFAITPGQTHGCAASHYPRPGTRLCGQQERPGLPAPALVSASWPKPRILRLAAILIWGSEKPSNL